MEDIVSARTIEKLVACRNETCARKLLFRPGNPVVTRGNDRLKRKVPAFKEMAKAGLCVVALTDLDVGECAPTLIREWFSVPQDKPVQLPSEVVFRVAVREVEAWLLSDRPSLSAFLGISEANFTSSPEDLPDPKKHLLDVVRRKGRKAWHRDMLPQSPTDSIGPGYNEALCQFVNEKWRPEQAASVAPSLSKALLALQNLP